MEADDAMSRLDQAGHLWRVLQSKLQAEETKLLFKVKQQRDLSRAIAARASNMFRPVVRHRIFHILQAICEASNATRSGLVVSSIRTLHKGRCTQRRFHRREARFGAGLAVVTNLMVLGTATPVLKFEQECGGLWREAQNLFGPMPSYMVY